ncbi:MAG: aldo/keto reductase, partial [Clostridia bacterium]|nr:aldo/keto reductase [Clostridia bacterium]
DSRAAKPGAFLTPERITKELLDKVSKLNDMAKYRGQTLSQMAISYLLGAVGVTSVLIGASSSKQIEENAKAVFNTTFTQDEIAKIDEIITK